MSLRIRGISACRQAVRLFGAGLLLGPLAAASPAAAGDVLDGLSVPQIFDAVRLTSLPAADLAVPADAEALALETLVPFSNDMVNSENVSVDGRGVYVALLDTGLLPEWPFLLSQANVAWELGKGFTHTLTWNDALGDVEFGPLDDTRGFITGWSSGHGTAMAGPIVGFNLADLFWVRGVAPQATIIPVLVVDGWRVDTPFGPYDIEGATDEMLAGGINYVTELAPTLDGPVIINLSLGRPDLGDIVFEALLRAIDNGVIVVAAAGNSGEEGLIYPAAFPPIISVGAAGWASLFAHDVFGDVPEKLATPDEAGNQRQFYLEDFSSRPNKALGQKAADLDVTAPGAWLAAPYKSAFADDLDYYYVSGTSGASPHVVAMAALLLQEHPALRQAEVETLLRQAATGCPLPASDAWVLFPFSDPPDYPATWSGGDAGKGFIQADALLKAAR
jgi:subtilisin family serine protease